jgi:transposase
VHSGEYSTAEVAELFGVGRSTVYRVIERQRVGRVDIDDPKRCDLPEPQPRRGRDREQVTVGEGELDGPRQLGLGQEAQLGA